MGLLLLKRCQKFSSEAHVAESSHGGPNSASNIDDGNTAEFGLEQCVKDSSKPIDVKEKIKATREQRLAYVDEQPPRPEWRLSRRYSHHRVTADFSSSTGATTYDVAGIYQQRLKPDTFPCS